MPNNPGEAYFTHRSKLQDKWFRFIVEPDFIVIVFQVNINSIVYIYYLKR